MPFQNHTTDYTAGAHDPCRTFVQNEPYFYEALKAEDQQAYSCLFLRLHNRFIPMACQRGGTYDEAVEVLNDCLAIFLLKVRRGEYAFQPTSKITTYLYAVCTNQWLTYVNKRQKRREVPLIWSMTDSEDTESVTLTEEDHLLNQADTTGDAGLMTADIPVDEPRDEFAEWLEWSERLQIALNSLREDCQKVLRWFYQEELSLRQIGQRLGMTEQSAAVKRFKCAKYLRDRYHAR